MTSSPTSKLRSSPHGTQAWLAVVRAYHLCDAAMSARLGEIGLRIGEHEVLANLATSPGLTQQQLAARCFVAKSGVSMLLAQMESQGLVLREADARDARVKRLALTREGQALAARSLKVQSEVIAAMVEGGTDAELAMVAQIMQRVSQRLEGLQQTAPVVRRARPAIR